MILVAGTGFLGERLLTLLAREGSDCAGLTLSEESARGVQERTGQRVFCADLADPSSLEKAALGLGLGVEGVDAIVHCASSNRGGAEAYQRVFVEGTRHLLSVFTPKRFVFSSSTSVYRQTKGERVDEDSAAEPSSETGRLLLEGERLALQYPKAAVMRLAGLYGPGRSFVLQRFLEGKASIDHPPEGGRWLNQIHIADAASAAFALATGEECGVFNVVDGNSLRQREVYEALAQRFDRPLPPRKEPRLDGKRGWTHKEVISKRLPRIGWAPAFANWLEALEADAELLPSIRRRITELGEA